MKLVSIETIPGQNYEVLGIVKGTIVQSKNFRKDFMADMKTLVMPNVHEFLGHIACDSASNSEIVVPIHKDGKVVGVLDIDSPDLNRFSEEDKLGLEKFVKALEEVITFE